MLAFLAALIGMLPRKRHSWDLTGKSDALTRWQVRWERTSSLPPYFWLTERRHCAPAAVWPAWPTRRLWRPGQSRCVSGRRSTRGQRKAPPESGTAACCWQNRPSERGRSQGSTFELVTTYTHTLRITHFCKGYSAGVVDTHENGHTTHDAWPFPLELVGLTQASVNAGIQQPNDSCTESKAALSVSWCNINYCVNVNIIIIIIILIINNKNINIARRRRNSCLLTSSPPQRAM